MTKEQVLALCKNEIEKERVEASFEAARRLHNNSKFEMLNDETAVIAYINSMVQAYTKKSAKKETEAKKNSILKNAIDNAIKAGKTPEDIATIINDAIKADVNKKIQAQIDALKAQLIK